jgi:hypothetical protein
MDYFPSEVLEVILVCCDAPSLCTCRIVCRKWKDAADFLQAADGYWMKACLRMINRNYLVELLGQAHGGMGQQQPEEKKKIFKRLNERVGDNEGEASEHDNEDNNLKDQTFDIDKLHWVDWKKMFSCWMKAKNVTKFKADDSKLRLDQVSCLAVSGSYVISGHESGSRNIWDAATNDCVSCPQVHTGQVRVVAPFDLLQEPPYHSSLHHHALVSGGKDGCLIVSVLLDQYCESYRLDQEIKIRQHSQSITNISILGSMMAVLSKENRVSNCSSI